ncbi:hypothetical protein FD755_016048 [Muntiacus reevesi]|uniref:RCC1 like n=1 Tax=Muntiacus reevesi TaxID=9886 RepID=A0A5N3XGB0_MUNRE|nr:hypothetical protein FD755_016048 [Muntiacus reevesi]
MDSGRALVELMRGGGGRGGCALLFQYVGEHVTHTNRIFVRGFSFSRALGVPPSCWPATDPSPLGQTISSAACGYGFTWLSSKTKDIMKVWGMRLNKDSQLRFHRIFSTGNNSYGQCGRKVVKKEIYIQVACSQNHSLLLTDKEVYSCGRHTHKLGGELARVNVVQVDTYGDCYLVVLAGGGLFRWGNSEYLQLASVTDSRQAVCGGTGCAVLNREGHVFVWGYGILGKGPNLLETALSEMIPPTLFGLMEFNPGVQESYLCEVRTSKGAWVEDQYFPWGVTIPGEPVDMVCGVDHMVTLIKSLI